MCGIAGIATRFESVDRFKLAAMERALVHRGPDDGESWLAEDGRVGLCHRRLSIQDLSPLGHQPMHSLDTRYTIVFNGEIYNFHKLRQKLLEDGCQLRSTGDTEVVLNLFAQKGLACVEDLEGMFAFAVWDREERTLSLARDPLGVKPLYIRQQDDSIVFASELRAICQGQDQGSLSKFALVGYLLTGSVPEEQSLVDGVEMLPAGSTLCWQGKKATPKKYWNVDFGHATHSAGLISRQEACQITRDALHESIKRHFVSDVPVGIFLSGGIDSTALVSLARQAGVRDIKTFSIAFDEGEYDEGSIAAKTAQHFATEHHVWRMTAKEGQELFSKHLAAMDQPSNDGFNTYCVSKFAHDHGLNVVLSGLGGDELFGSYPSFRKIPKLLRLHRWLRIVPMSGAATRIAGKIFRPNGPKARMKDFLQGDGRVSDAYLAMRGFFDQDACRRILSQFQSDNSEVDDMIAAVFQKASEGVGDWQLADQISYLELTRYMRNQLLRDSDVMSMAWGLELRVPLVDRRLFQAVSRIPAAIRLEEGKRLLADAAGEIPQWVIDQPKRGFRFPFQVWMEQDAAWQQKFSAVVEKSPVKLDSWYQRWMLFVLQESLKTLGLAC